MFGLELRENIITLNAKDEIDTNDPPLCPRYWHRIPQGLRQAVLHPTEHIMMVLGALAEGTIAYTNSNVALDSFTKKTSLYTIIPTAFLSIVMAFQFFSMDGRSMIELVKKGYRFGNTQKNYTESLHWSLKPLAILGVNMLPIASAMTFGLLGLVETYHLIHTPTLDMTKEELLASRLTWSFAGTLGFIYFLCRLALYSRRFKVFLAYKTYEATHQKSWLEPIKNAWTALKSDFLNDRKGLLKKSLVYGLCFLLSGMAAIIAYGALLETSDALYEKSHSAEPTNRDFLPSGITALFALISSFVGLETYVAEGRSLIEIAGLSDEKALASENNAFQPITEPNAYKHYHLKDFLRDTIFISIVGIVKLSVDWVLLGELSAQELTPEYTATTAAVTGTLAGAGVIIMNRYRWEPSEGAKQNNVGGLQRGRKARKKHYEERSVASEDEQESEKVDEDPIKPTFRSSCVTGFSALMLSTLTFFAVQYGLRHEVFKGSKHPEEALDIAQLLSAFFGALIAIVVERIAGGIFQSEHGSGCSNYIGVFWRRLRLSGSEQENQPILKSEETSSARPQSSING